ncbi:MAG: intradiol ring-cleavage dioxygenase [Dehalococcoidia bacterium]
MIFKFQSLQRRGLLRALAALPFTSLAAACGIGGKSSSPTGPAAPAAPAAGAPLAPTPACAEPDDLTPSQTEGPYFTPNSPLRVSLIENGVSGTRLLLTGQVLTTNCLPVARALVDFWQCDGQGQYDNRGYRLRGHQFTTADGRYSLETIVPGVYPGRTRHIHVKVQAPNRPVLTTQLYFPNEPANQRDGIFNPVLVMAYTDRPDGKGGEFDFVLRA